MVSVCQELHEKLDSLIKLCEDGIIDDCLQWKEKFEVDSRLYRESLRSELERDHSWKNELKNTEAQAEALSLLLFEANRRAEQYDPDELKWIHKVFGHVVRLSKLGIPPLPAWFLPPHEVEVMDQIGSGSYGSVYGGFWRGAQVVIKSVICMKTLTIAKCLRRKPTFGQACSILTS